MVLQTVSTQVASATLLPGPFGTGGGKVEGVVHPAWGRAQKAFEENFAHNLELGAQLHITHEGNVVADLSGMSRRQEKSDQAAGRPAYNRDTLQNCYSSGKNMEAVCIAILVDRGLLAYDDLVARHWPEFGRHGKDKVTVADVLRHEGGVPFFSDPDDMTDYKRDKKVTVSDIREITPLEQIVESSGYWDLTGERHYHACTRGWLLSGIIRRVDPKGRTLGQFLKDEISTPLGVDIYCGIPIADQSKFNFADVQNMHPKYAILRYVLPAIAGVGDPALKGVIETYKKKSNPVKRHGVGTWMKSKDDATWFNTVEGRKVEMPSANIQSNARSLGKVAALMANNGAVGGTTLLSENTIKLALSDNKLAYDGFLNATYSFSKGGFSDFGDMNSITVNPEFSKIYSGFTGWCGLGGSLFLWNSERRVGFNYNMNGKSLLPICGPRGDRIMKAVQRILRTI